MIDVKNLKFGYKLFRNELFKGIDISFDSGKVYGILGKNGSGKTTFLNIISSLIVNYNGTVKLDNISSKKRNRDYLKNIFYLPEDNLDFSRKIKNLKYLGRTYPNWDEKKFFNIIKKENLKPEQNIKNLSKGWKKRVAFYFAISVDPEILLLDEVSEGIDIIAQKELIEYLLDYFNENKTVIISSHHIEEFEKIIDEFVILDDGKIVYKGEKEYVETNFGWTEIENRSRLNSDDILMEKSIFGKKFILTENRKKYKNIDFENIDLATFLKVMVNRGGKNV